MSATVKRTCFFSIIDGKIRPQEWAVVIRDDGKSYLEPFWPFQSAMNVRNGTADSVTDDFTDEMQMVNEFVQVDDASYHKAINFGSETVLHGGRNVPRKGR